MTQFSSRFVLGAVTRGSHTKSSIKPYEMTNLLPKMDGDNGSEISETTRSYA